MNFKIALCDIFLCILVRCVFLIQISFSIYFLSHFLDEIAYFTLIFCFLIVFFDTSFVIFARHGNEYKWFSISCFAYSITVITLIWNLLLQKLIIYSDGFCPNDDGFNETTKDDSLTQFWLFKSIDICQMMEISVSLYILTCCFFKWASPMKLKSLKDKAFLDVLISYITNGADIVDFFSQLDDTGVVFNFSFSIAIFVFFALSSLQFSFGLSATVIGSKERMNPFKYLILGTEIWALFFVLIFQDLPFSILRIMILVYYNQLSKNYTLYFFAAKNLVLSLYEIYLISLISYQERDIFKSKNRFHHFTVL